MTPDLSPTRSDLLERYAELLLEKAVPLGFVSRSDREVLRSRHVEDSLRAVETFSPDDRHCYDLGSGAGLPGIPLAVALPHVRFWLVESQRRRVAFLELAVERLGLENVSVLGARVEEVAGRVSTGDLPPAEVVTARAFAPLQDSWRDALPLLGPRGRLVYFAGAGMEDPEGVARAAGGGEADVQVRGVLANSGPLVIMTRT